MPINLAALKTELTTDPLGRGYAVMTDEQAAASLALSDRQADRDMLDSALLVASIVRAEYATLSANDKDYVRLVGAVDGPLPLTANLKTQLGAIFPAGSATRANLVALLKRTGSRAEELNLGGSPTPSDVADAKRLP